MSKQSVVTVVQVQCRDFFLGGGLHTVAIWGSQGQETLTEALKQNQGTLPLYSCLGFMHGHKSTCGQLIVPLYLCHYIK